jgi:hypothetical protein
VDFARDHGGVLLAVKCGGHSYSGLSTCARGMMIDLSRFRHVGIDPAARKAWVAGGTLLGQVDHESMAHGLATTMGTVSHTGAGGLITGGGFGRLGRRFGLSIDNVTAVQVVTANGRLVRASADEHADLFWGVRGGGGNFGVVTSFELQLHPMQRQVMAGSIVYPIARARDALHVFAEQQAVIPDELALEFVMVQPPGQEPGVFVFEVCYSGPPERLDALLAPIRRLGKPLKDEVVPKDYVAVQRSGDISDPRSQGMYLKGGFVPDVTPALIDAIVDGFQGDPTRATAIFAQAGGGAIARVAPEATCVPAARSQGEPALLRRLAVRRGSRPPHRLAARLLVGAGAIHVRLLRQRPAAGPLSGRHPGELPREPRAARRRQEHVRPDEPVPAERQHPAAGALNSAGGGAEQANPLQVGQRVQPLGQRRRHRGADLDPAPAPPQPQQSARPVARTLGLPRAEEAAVVAFLRTLSDGFTPGGRGKHPR